LDGVRLLGYDDSIRQGSDCICIDDIPGRLGFVNLGLDNWIKLESSEICISVAVIDSFGLEINA
jgi:hypothetical protein